MGLRLGCKVMDGLMHMIWIMMHMRQSMGKTTGAPGQKGTWQLSILLWYVAVQWGKRKDRIVWSMKVGLEMAVNFLELCPNAIWPCIMIPGAIPRCLHSFTSKGYAQAFSGGLSEDASCRMPRVFRELTELQEGSPLRVQSYRRPSPCIHKGTDWEGWSRLQSSHVGSSWGQAFVWRSTTGCVFLSFPEDQLHCCLLGLP